MSVELYPDHKAILHFQDSLKVYEIDFLDYLTKFLSADEYAKRHFDIYVKPTLSHSSFDFIVVEPNRRIYIIHTPESMDQYLVGNETFEYFMNQRLHTLSPTLHRRIQRTVKDNQFEKSAQIIKQLYYIYDESLLEDILSLNDDEDFEKIVEDKLSKDIIVGGSDFIEHSQMLTDLFEVPKQSDNRLTGKETHEAKQTLNPNTNIVDYIPKTLPKDYEEKAQSVSQSKQKFKGPEGSGKTLLLAKRIINCANRLKNSNRILVISGDITKVNHLKDIITAEDGRSLQELGIDISSFQELAAPKKRYQALFVDDAQFIKSDWFDYLLTHYLIDMTDEEDYEYVVMADEDNLPTIPKIHGPFRTLKFDFRRIQKMLNDSREIFLDILGQ